MNNIQNTDDNECFEWSIVRHLNPINHHPAGITKADKDFVKKLDFKDIQNLQSKLEICTKLKKRVPSALVFLVLKIKKNIQSNLYIKKIL